MSIAPPYEHFSRNASVDIKNISTPALYSLLEPCIIPPSSPRAKFANWSRTYHCTPFLVFEPSDVDQCRLIFQLAHREQRSVRIIGEGLSPSDLPCTSDYMLRTSKLNKVRVVRYQFLICANREPCTSDIYIWIYRWTLRNNLSYAMEESSLKI
jgi:L-gulonolactone oxidase